MELVAVIVCRECRIVPSIIDGTNENKREMCPKRLSTEMALLRVCQPNTNASRVTHFRHHKTSFSFISARQPGSLRTSPLWVVSAFPLIWQWEMPPPIIMLYSTYSVSELPCTTAPSNISTPDGRRAPSFPRARNGKVLWHVYLTHMANVLPFRIARALPMVAQIQAITFMLLIWITKWTIMGSKPKSAGCVLLSKLPIWLWHAH